MDDKYNTSHEVAMQQNVIKNPGFATLDTRDVGEPHGKQAEPGNTHTQYAFPVQPSENDGGMQAEARSPAGQTVLRCPKILLSWVGNYSQSGSKPTNPTRLTGNCKQ